MPKTIITMLLIPIRYFLGRTFLLLLVTISFAMTIYLSTGQNIPFVARKRVYSIGIYTGSSPIDLRPSTTVQNPVITAKDVSDVPARFVADPFMVKDNSTWYMFFEIFNNATDQGDIGLAVSRDGLSWTYQRVVVDEQFHLSFPHIFKWQNQYYMVPESSEAGAVRLYQATEFPTQWTFVGNIMDNVQYVDPMLIEQKGTWWLFAGESPVKTSTLHLFYGPTMLGPWTRHPDSPIVSNDLDKARLGGRIIADDNRLLRYTQDGSPTYGYQLRAFEITELTPQRYSEQEVSTSPLLTPSGVGWNAHGMHHADVHRLDTQHWIAVVDGWTIGPLEFGLNN